MPSKIVLVVVRKLHFLSMWALSVRMLECPDMALAFTEYVIWERGRRKCV